MRFQELSIDAGKYPNERVEIFVDNSNLYHALKSECGRVDLDYLKFARKLANGRKLIRINLYVATYDPQMSPEKSQKQNYFIEDVLTQPYIAVKRRELNYKGGQPYEKGIDILIAADIIALALENRYDTCVLVTGDGDFAPVLNMVRRAGKHVENACFDRRRSKALADSSDVFIELTPDDMKECFKSGYHAAK